MVRSTAIQHDRVDKPGIKRCRGLGSIESAVMSRFSKDFHKRESFLIARRTWMENFRIFDIAM